MRINQWFTKLKPNVKLFADDTSLFTFVKDNNESANVAYCIVLSNIKQKTALKKSSLFLYYIKTSYKKASLPLHDEILYLLRFYILRNSHWVSF